MTPFARAFRNLAQRLRKRFYEGPSPPQRLSDIVVAFANAHPEATRQDWAEFAAAHAAECYRSGYQRGYEWTERDLARRDPMVDPEHMMDELGHGWDWLDEPVDLYDPDGVPSGPAA